MHAHSHLLDIRRWHWDQTRTAHSAHQVSSLGGICNGGLPAAHLCKVHNPLVVRQEFVLWQGDFVRGKEKKRWLDGFGTDILGQGVWYLQFASFDEVLNVRIV